MRLIDTSLPEAFRLKEEIEADLKQINKGSEGLTFALALEKYLEIEHFRKKENLPDEESRTLDTIIYELKKKLKETAKTTLGVSNKAITTLQHIKEKKTIPLKDISSAQNTLLKLLIGEVFFPKDLHQGINRTSILSQWMTEFSVMSEAPITKQLLSPELDFFKNQFELLKAA